MSDNTRGGRWFMLHSVALTVLRFTSGPLCEGISRPLLTFVASRTSVTYSAAASP